MSGLNALKLVATKRQANADPKALRRRKLSDKIGEQLLLAKAVQQGSTYAPMRFKTLRDTQTGEMKTVEAPKRIKPWWWISENGKTYLAIKYGAKTIELQRGKNAIEAANLQEVISTLQIVKTAAESGELDTQIESLSGQVKQGFKREILTLKKPVTSA